MSGLSACACSPVAPCHPAGGPAVLPQLPLETQHSPGTWILQKSCIICSYVSAPAMASDQRPLFLCCLSHSCEHDISRMPCGKWRFNLDLLTSVWLTFNVLEFCGTRESISVFGHPGKTHSTCRIWNLFTEMNILIDNIYPSGSRVCLIRRPLSLYFSCPVDSFLHDKHKLVPSRMIKKK